jgi:type II secretory pathway pseudopilin PulG
MSLVEVTVALAIIAVLAVIVAQCIAWGLRERARTLTQQAALELAANMLEAARAQPWDLLDQAWADGQTIPADMEALFPDGKLSMTVEPGPRGSATRRVTVDVTWQFEPHLPAQIVQLTTLLSGRVTEKPGGQP